MSTRGWLQQPLLSLVLLLGWLLLVDEFASPGHWVFGALLALAIPRLVGHWWPPLPRIASWPALLLFVWRSLVDIVMGNLQVMRLALGPQRSIQPVFVTFHSELDNELAIFMLMGAISLAPGSVSTHFNPADNSIEVHALHCTDEAQLVADIRERYEQLLKKVFAPC